MTGVIHDSNATSNAGLYIYIYIYLYLKILKRQRQDKININPSENRNTRRPNNSTISTIRVSISPLPSPPTRQTTQISRFPTSKPVKIGGNSRISARISYRFARTTEFTTRIGLSRFVVSVQLVGENVGRLVVAARNIYSKNYGSCISVHSSRQVPRRCIGGSYARDAVRYVKAEHVNEFIRARRLFFAPPPILLFFLCSFSTGERVVSRSKGKKQSECAFVYFYLIKFVRSCPS